MKARGGETVGGSAGSRSGRWSIIGPWLRSRSRWRAVPGGAALSSSLAGRPARHPPAADRGRPGSTGPWSVPGRSAGATGAPDRPAQRSADDVDHLVDIGVGLAMLRGGPDAALDVVLEDEDREGIDRGAQRGRLLEDVDAVLLALDHPGDPADLALHPRQAADQAGLVLGVAVTEVRGRRSGGATGRAGGHGRDSDRVMSSDDTPWGYPWATEGYRGRPARSSAARPPTG